MELVGEDAKSVCFLPALTVNQHVHCRHVSIEKNINCANLYVERQFIVNQAVISTRVEHDRLSCGEILG